MVLLQFPTADWGTWSQVIGSQPPTPPAPTPARKQKPRKRSLPVYAVGVTVECCSYVIRARGRDPRWREGVISRVQVINGVTWYTIPAANGFPFMYTADNVRLPIIVRPDTTPARRLA